MDKAKRGLINGTVIYFIGNVLVALVQLLILRFITGNIDTSSYGYYNLIVTIDNLVTPIITLQISDAVFRYMIKEDESGKKTVFTDGCTVILIGIGLTTLFISVYSAFIYKIEFTALVILYIVSTNIFAFYQKMARALGENIEYVKSNLIKTALYLILQMVFIYQLDIEGESLFLANTIAIFACIFYLEFKLKCRRFFSLSFFDKKYLKKMITFSLPLIPNTILWWLGNSVNSMVVSGVLGLDANGIYSAAGRFGSVVSMFASVFNLAWQESAIREYGSTGSKAFYSDAFKMFYRFIFSGVALCMPVMYFAMPLLLDQSYHEAILYAPILVLSAGVAAFYGFFGQMYAATEKTKGAFTTTIYGVVANLAILVLTINSIGLWSPCIALLGSGTAISIARVIQFRNDIDIKFEPGMIVLFIEIVVGIVVYYLGNSVLNVISAVVILCLAIFLNRELLIDLISEVKEMIGGRK
ncbi:MAG: oligosaccharide flippase family protein [Ruminococcus sp.]|nr:oligosaccharide flippase family protein [Ruminococcus sp.]MCC8154726.1 oligosaccharide flippase family protein [Tannerellaceae bacterium]